MITIGLGISKSLAELKLHHLRKRFKRVFLGVGVTSNWDTEYSATIFNCKPNAVDVEAKDWNEEAILIDECGKGFLVWDKNKEDSPPEYLGRSEVHRREGDIDDLFDKQVARKLLNELKVTGLTAYNIPHRKGYVVQSYS